MVGGSGYILAGGGWWMGVDIFWLVVGGGAWWWKCFGWWWVVVDGGGWWHSLVKMFWIIYCHCRCCKKSLFEVTTTSVRHFGNICVKWALRSGGKLVSFEPKQFYKCYKFMFFFFLELLFIDWL